MATLDIAQLMDDEAEEKSEEEQVEMTDQVQYNQNCTQQIARLLLDSKDPEMASRAHEVMIEANEAAQGSTSKLRMLQRRNDFMQWLEGRWCDRNTLSG
jgi:hypothetical protein